MSFIGITGNRDVDFLILSKLDDVGLFIFYRENYINKLSKDEHFWMNRTFQKFGKINKPKTNELEKFLFTY